MTGNLGIFSLTDLLQLLSNSTQTGNLKIDHPEGEAHVYFDNGKIVHAELNDQIGEVAIKTLFTQESGDFEFQADQTYAEALVGRTIHKDTDMLLLQALGTAEEARIVDSSQKLPTLAIPYFVNTDKLKQSAKLSPTDLVLTAEDQVILKMVDGERTVQTMAIETGIDIGSVKSIIHRFIEEEVLSITKPEIRVARLVVRLGPEKLPHGTVAIDRKILKSWSKHLNYPVSQIKCKHPNGQILVFKAEAREKLGPYMDVTQEVLIQQALLADMALLVKPRRETS